MAKKITIKKTISTRKKRKTTSSSSIIKKATSSTYSQYKNAINWLGGGS